MARGSFARGGKLHAAMSVKAELRFDGTSKQCNGNHLYPLPGEVWRTEMHENGVDQVLVVEYPEVTLLRPIVTIYQLKLFTVAHPPYVRRVLRALKSWFFMAFMVLRIKLSCDTLQSAVRCGEHVHPIIFGHRTPRFLKKFRARMDAE